MKALRLIIGVIVIVIFLNGCQSAENAAIPDITSTSTATKDISTEQTATRQAEQEADASASKTAAAVATQDAQATVDAQASATSARETQIAFDRAATSTQKAVQKATQTAEAISESTAIAQPLYDIVQQLYADGAIKSTEGEYVPVEGFDESWAKLNYYDFFPIPEAFLIDTNNFVIRADLEWRSASDIANWDRSGCGFIVIDPETTKHHFVYLSMDGYASLSYNDGGTRAYINVQRPTKVKGGSEGQAEVVLAIQDKRISFYVDGEEAFSFNDPKYIPGILTYSLVSGTNKGFGTHCKMSNVGLWAMDVEE